MISYSYLFFVFWIFFGFQVWIQIIPTTYQGNKIIYIKYKWTYPKQSNQQHLDAADVVCVVCLSLELLKFFFFQQLYSPTTPHVAPKLLTPPQTAAILANQEEPQRRSSAVYDDDNDGSKICCGPFFPYCSSPLLSPNRDLCIQNEPAKKSLIRRFLGMLKRQN